MLVYYWSTSKYNWLYWPILLYILIYQVSISPHKDQIRHWRGLRNKLLNEYWVSVLKFCRQYILVYFIRKTYKEIGNLPAKFNLKSCSNTQIFTWASGKVPFLDNIGFSWCGCVVWQRIKRINVAYCKLL